MTGDSLRLIFMGTPSFAVPALAALVEAGHEVIGVFTQPDRRSGRGRRLVASPVKEFAQSRGMMVFQSASLREDAEARRRIADLGPDAIVVAAYGLFLPSDTLAAPRLGCLNIHPSLLPRHRGPSPVATAVLEGDAITGVTIMLLDEGMDTGPILAQRETAIAPDEFCDALTARLFDIGARLLIESLEKWNAGGITPIAQREEEATITRRLRREDGLIDWNRSARELARKVRAFTPWPGTFTRWNGKTLKILRAVPSDSGLGADPGTVVNTGGGNIAAATGLGSLRLIEVQAEGRRPSPAADFARGHSDFVGAKLGQ